MIELTRGDSLNLNLSLQSEDGSAYEFKIGDKIIFSVFNKNKMSDPAILSKTFIVNQNGKRVIYIRFSFFRVINTYYYRRSD